MKIQLTLRDIAEVAGVSEMTVSRALRDSSDVSERTRERIKKIASEMGYVPNKIAGSLASKTVDLVGVVIPSVRSLVFGQVLDGISHSLAASKLRPVFGITNYDLDSEEQVIRDMLSWRPSGLIVAGLEHNDATIQMMRNTNVPVVEIMDVDGEPVHTAIGISHFDAGYEMGKAIFAKGHKHVGFIGSKIELDFRAKKRKDGFLRAIEEFNGTLVGIEQYTDGSSMGTGRELAAKLLAQHKNLECIYCSTDVLAVGAFMHCMAEGIDVPGQLGIAGFSNLSILEGMPRQIATTDSRRYDTGRKAAEFILEQMKSSNPEPAGAIRLHSEVILGDTL